VYQLGDPDAWPNPELSSEAVTDPELRSKIRGLMAARDLPSRRSFIEPVGPDQCA